MRSPQIRQKYKTCWRSGHDQFLQSDSTTIIMLAILLLCLAAGASAKRVIGGSNGDISDFPWQCSLRYNGGHTCGCVIISSDWVLSAAHCVEGRDVA